MTQNLIVYLLTGLSIAFLIYRMVPRKKKKDKCRADEEDLDGKAIPRCEGGLAFIDGA